MPSKVKVTRKRRPYVAMLVDTSTSWSTDVIRGFHDYAAEHGPWIFHVEPTGRFEQPRPARNWKGDGILSRVTTLDYAEDLLAMRLPLVSVSGSDPTRGQLPRCTADNSLAGRMAASHFAERGFRNFAYIGISERRDHDPNLQRHAYLEELAAKGHEADVFEPTKIRKRRRQYDAFSPELASWLRDLPKPVAILTWNALEGRRVAEACRLASLRVPEEVAIVAGEHDDLICDLSSPPLSSVDCRPRNVGYQAAALLDDLMRGKKPPNSPILLEPKGVMLRQSSDIVAIDNEHLSRAISFIRNHALEGIRVKDVLEHVPLGRRTLEQQFREVLGRSPAEEIRYVRLLHAEKLLVETNWTIARIAHASGFGSHDILLRNFQRVHPMTPSEFRQRYRQRR